MRLYHKKTFFGPTIEILSFFWPVPVFSPYQLDPGQQYILGIVIDGDFENVPYQEEYNLIIEDPFPISKDK